MSKTKQVTKPDKCKNSDYGDGKLDWQNCGICEGRIHEEDCTTKKVAGKDCLNNHTDEEYKTAGYGEPTVTSPEEAA